MPPLLLSIPMPDTSIMAWKFQPDRAGIMSADKHAQTIKFTHRKYRVHTPIHPSSHCRVTHGETGYFRPAETETVIHTWNSLVPLWIEALSVPDRVYAACAYVCIYMCVFMCKSRSLGNEALSHTNTQPQLCLTSFFSHHVHVFPGYLCKVWLTGQRGLLTEKEEGTSSGCKKNAWVVVVYCVDSWGLSWCSKCNVWAQHNYTGMGVLKDMEGSRWGDALVCVSCVSMSDFEHTSTLMHALIQLLPGCNLAHWGG